MTFNSAMGGESFMFAFSAVSATEIANISRGLPAAAGVYQTRVYQTRMREVPGLRLAIGPAG
jgi:hypothetical protein